LIEEFDFFSTLHRTVAEAIVGAIVSHLWRCNIPPLLHFREELARTGYQKDRSRQIQSLTLIYGLIWRYTDNDLPKGKAWPPRTSFEKFTANRDSFKNPQV
jgi:hypothetical protein